MGTQYYCKNKARRDKLRGHESLNGIDFLEVLDDKAMPWDERQRILVIHMINPLDNNIDITEEGIGIDGGVRIKHIRVLWTYRASLFSSAASETSVKPNCLVSEKAREILSTLENKDRVLVVRTDSAGDFSTYTLRIFPDPGTAGNLDWLDTHLSEVDFSFKVECLSLFDCKSEQKCPPPAYPEPGIDYLAKDYTGFRRLMLDRLSLLMPGWRERNPADLQIALVELLAYVGDHLSYYQDAVATEAYLGTARRRISMRRFARILDYGMHDGCNARAWVFFKVRPGEGEVKIPAGTPLFTRCRDTGYMIPQHEAEKILTAHKPEVFETMFDITLYPVFNEMTFHTWGDKECCLPKGATEADLCIDADFNLEKEKWKNSFLLFEEVLGPTTGEPGDRNLFNRHVVRVVDMKEASDPIYDDQLLADNKKLVTIRWHEEDALPFPLCISTVIQKKGSLEPLENVSTARGNIVLADHGRTITGTDTFSTDQIKNRYVEPLRFSRGPITYTEGFKPGEGNSAASAVRRQKDKCLPSVSLLEGPGDENTWWKPQKDLLASDRFAREFVVETETDGTAYIRFGDGTMGKEPDTDKELTPTYRVGNGTEGNVGAEIISHIVPLQGSGITGIIEIRNPMPAVGGTEPESMEQVRQYAPQAFRTQERAVTQQDYADVAMRYPGVQKAVASFRWTGSWYTVFLVVDREQGKPVEKDEEFKENIYQHMERYRMAGFDLELADPLYVPLEIVMEVCVKPGYIKSDVEEVLLGVFSNYEWAPGKRGFFHPDNFTFAQPLYLSRIYEAAVNVEGVASAEVTTFKRWGREPDNEIDNGILKTGTVEIIRLDNDPDFPENGKIEFQLKGGM